MRAAKSKIFYFLSRNILKLLLKTFFRLRVFGLENLPGRGPYIVACNHASYMDPPILGAGMPVRVNFLAREDLFKKNLFGLWIRNVGCIPLKRGKSDIKAIKEALRLLGKGEIVAIFPEGTRSADGSIQDARQGMAFLAVKAGVPILPVYIKGSKFALPKNARFFKLCPISVYFGEKVDMATFEKAGSSKKNYQEITRRVMDRMAGLREEHGD